MTARLLVPLCLPFFLLAADQTEHARRVREIARTPGFVALWDFVERTPDGAFDAHKDHGDPHDYRLIPLNYVLSFWNQGRPASFDDFPLLGRGPFGNAIQIRNETDPTFRPLLQIPRVRLHDSPLDVKGPGRSVSLLAWILRESGNHAIAGIWHEGTDLGGAALAQRGMRQYALFAGLAANPGASAVHVSENGASSFGDRYARNLAVTPELIPSAWAVAGFTFDNARNEVTAYLDGQATEYWIDEPTSHPFFQWPARGWLQAQLHSQPGLQDGELADFPRDQFYAPPEDLPLRRTVLSTDANARVELHEFAYTRVRVTYAANGAVARRELAALRANPFWFPHDLYSPPTQQAGGPFTIGRVIHTSRSVGFTGWIGAVAVFSRALQPSEMLRLSRVAAAGPITLD